MHVFLFITLIVAISMLTGYGIAQTRYYKNALKNLENLNKSIELLSEWRKVIPETSIPTELLQKTLKFYESLNFK